MSLNLEPSKPRWILLDGDLTTTLPWRTETSSSCMINKDPLMRGPPEQQPRTNTTVRNTMADTTNTAYQAIPKGRGFVYAHMNQLYRQVKKHGSTIYLKCFYEFCDGSAKLESGEFSIGVSEIEVCSSNVMYTKIVFTPSYVPRWTGVRMVSNSFSRLCGMSEDCLLSVTQSWSNSCRWRWLLRNS